MDGTPRGCWHLPGRDDSEVSSAFSLGLPQHCGISPRCGSDRRFSPASAAVSTHPYGFLGLCKMYPKVITHSSAIPELGLCEDTNSWPNGCWHLPSHVLDRGMGFLMGRERPLLVLGSELSLDGPYGGVIKVTTMHVASISHTQLMPNTQWELANLAYKWASRVTRTKPGGPEVPKKRPGRAQPLLLLFRSNPPTEGGGGEKAAPSA
jgi:hypothetical protein